MNQNNRDYFIKVTVALYKVTELLPQQEPLRVLLRTKANELLEKALVLTFRAPILTTTQERQGLLGGFTLHWEILTAYLDLSKQQDWLDPKNFEVLAREYEALKQGLLLEVARQPEPKITEEYLRAARTTKSTNSATRKPSVAGGDWNIITNLHNSRHKKIVEVLKSKGAAQVKDIEGILPQFSKRTLRRDFAYLYKTGAVERMGDGSATVYRLKAAL